MTGTVKWYDEVKGYGFIQQDDNTDLFVHRSGLLNSGSGLAEGQKVEFETKQSDKGPLAVNVKAI
jgi:cold shock protein